jgi:hypothetical protein
LWGSNDPKAIGVEAIYHRDLEAVGSGAPRATVECNMREVYLVKRRSQQEFTRPTTFFGRQLVSFTHASRFTFHEIR